MKKNIVLTLICLSASIAGGSAQGSTDRALEKLALARQSMEQGLNDRAITLLDEADALDPAPTYIYFYEKARALLRGGYHGEAMDMLRRSLRFDDAPDIAYHMLGSVYEIAGEPRKALSTYARGIAKFPDSGKLYGEAGRLEAGRGDSIAALDLYLRGLEADPLYASNWYDAARLYLASDDAAFGIIDAETFMNIELAGDRTREMGEMLTKAYRDNITFPGDTIVVTNFSSGASRIDALLYNDITPFPVAYDIILSLAADIAGVRGTDILSLIIIRRYFIEIWFTQELNRIYACPLFDYHRAVIEAGHFEAYNYWLFSHSDEAAFEVWLRDHRAAFDAFSEWFDRNNITDFLEQ